MTSQSKYFIYPDRKRRPSPDGPSNRDGNQKMSI